MSVALELLPPEPLAGPWCWSSSSDPRALALVDGTGPFAEHGPHYSRRTPGSKTFTGVGQEIVLVTECGRAVWACVRHMAPARIGTSNPSRKRASAIVAVGTPPGGAQLQSAGRARFLWRNIVFRNLGAGLSSELVRSAVEATYLAWAARYGALPPERLRTEIDVRRVRSSNPGCCYLLAGWEKGPLVRGKRYLYAPARAI